MKINKQSRFLSNAVDSVWIALALTLGGCMAKMPERVRPYTTATPGYHLTGRRGPTQLRKFFFENNGTVIPVTAGISILSIPGLRRPWRYHYHRNKQMLMQSDRQFIQAQCRSVDLLCQPDVSGELEDAAPTKKTAIADEVALNRPALFDENSARVLTFFGYKSMGIAPEFPSAFWEDNIPIC